MNRQVTVLGGGCFWCLEAVYQEVSGVLSVESGYTGGQTERPSYEQVCEGDTGHAEVVRIEFDADRISFRQMLEIFFSIHDPTTLNRQGNDVGTQYRSVIFTVDDGQREVARELIAELERDHVFGRPIVTRVEPLGRYHPGEAYHQRYFERHPEQGYCSVIIAPKLAKFRKTWASHLKGAQEG